MAKKDQGKSKKDAKQKPSWWARLKKWFTNIITELKRVVWPDKKKLRQSTATVLLIIFIAVIIILAFDSAIRGIFNATGFYGKAPVETEAPDAADHDHDHDQDARR
jgi:preprotein translocase subunit SecE